ncbi:hypothetical protein AAES_40732 [Amazona aestiva]|uniref:Uncharacterized protein n=1 Tax=Amazona aestiva TaxID=12930 RepID=A0A0Q3MSF7_AMAAE|nr:hypothetical protein AAES_40732 [Amazona aestiva]
MELLCLLGVLCSFGALLLEPLRDSLVFALLWVLYLSLYQVGQVFLYFQCCACVRGCFWKLWATLQWVIFATAAMGVFAISLVPFTYIEQESNGQLWPGIHQAFGAVQRLQLVNSYGLFRRMTGVGGRPEVVLEGSYDGQSWTL